MNEDVKALKDPLENLNIRKSTSRRIQSGTCILLKTSEEFSINNQFDKHCERHLSSMISVGNQMVSS